MTDPISHLGRSSTQLNVGSDKPKPKKVDEGLKDNALTQKQDEVILSEAAKKSLAKAEFDEVKVAQIKAAIRDGNYPIDAKKVAESFASLEKMIGGK